MTLCKLMVYAQSIVESKLRRGGRDVKRGRTDELGQPSCKKKASNKNVLNDLKAIYKRCGASKIDISTSSYCGKQFFLKCLDATNGCFGCGKDDHKARYCSTIAIGG